MSEKDHKKLGRAATSLRSAEELVEDGDIEDQLDAEAHALADLAGRDRAPDERRVRGHRHTLRDLHGKTMHDDAKAHISRALDNVHSVEDVI